MSRFAQKEIYVYMPNGLCFIISTGHWQMEMAVTRRLQVMADLYGDHCHDEKNRDHQ